MSGVGVAGVLCPIGKIQPARFPLAKCLANCIPLSTPDYKGGVTLHASPVRLVGKVDFQFGSEGIAGGLASWEFRIRRMTHWVFLALLRPAFILAARVLPSTPPLSQGRAALLRRAVVVITNLEPSRVLKQVRITFALRHDSFKIVLAGSRNSPSPSGSM